MFERFTDAAREAVVLAQVEARSLRHGWIGTEHLLLGVARQPVGIGRRVLERLGMDADAIHGDVVRRIGEGGPFDSRDEDALRAIGIDLDEVRRRVEETFGPGALERSTQRTRGRRACGPLFDAHIPFTRRAKKSLELALREARALGHNYLGTEHLLLGLAREEEGLAATILRDFGVDRDRLRATVLEALGHGRRGDGDPPQPVAC